MRKRPGWKILVSRGGEENWAERGDSKVVGQGNDRRIFLSFFLLAELFPIPRQYSGKKKRIGWRKVGKEKNRKRERERERFDLASIRRAAHGWTDSPRQTAALSEEMDRWSGSCSIAPRAESKSRCVYSRTFVFRSCPSSPRIGGWKIQPLGWFTTASIRPSIPLVRQMQFSPGKVASTSRISPSSSRLIGSLSVRIWRLYLPPLLLHKFEHLSIDI